MFAFAVRRRAPRLGAAADGQGGVGRGRRRPRGMARRAGNILVLTAFLMIGMMGMLAFSIDLGVLYVAREELQRTADSAAMAGAWDLVNQDPSTTTNFDPLENGARATAGQFAQQNTVLSQAPTLTYDDVSVGYLINPSDTTESLHLDGARAPNAVKVKVRRSASSGTGIPLFFARALGMQSASMEAEATAALLTNISGFKTPSDGGNVNFLPFAMDETTWNAMLAGGGTDAYKWNSSAQVVQSGSDGVREVNLYPQGTGSPGNRGTVDVGSSNNSTADIARQISEGVSPEDLAHHGGELKLNSAGELYLNGDTGISAGVKDELAAIIGETRIIPIYRSVTGPGNNATYKIVKFVGVRILAVKLTGSMSSKMVMVQPAAVVSKGGISSGSTSSSSFVYSPVWLVR